MRTQQEIGFTTFGEGIAMIDETAKSPIGGVENGGAIEDPPKFGELSSVTNETTYITMGGPEEGNGNIDESERKPPQRPRSLGQLALLVDTANRRDVLGGDDEQDWADAA